MPLTAVAPHKLFPGVHAPGDRVKVTRNGVTSYQQHTFDWRFPPHSPENTRPITPAYAISDLTNALTTTYESDAHCVTHVIRQDGAPPLHQPRLTNDGLDWLLSQGFTVNTEFFMADLDTPGHRPWRSDKEAREAAETVLARNPKTGVYASAKGLRVIQLISRPIDVREAKGAITAWLEQLNPCGLKVGFECADWTRHFRMPHVMRSVEVGGRMVPRSFSSPAVLLDRMDWITPSLARSHRARARRSRAISVELAVDVPAAFSPLVRRVALAIRQSGGFAGERHSLFLALAGALLRRRIPAEYVPSMVADIASLSGAEDPLHHRDSAVATVGRWAQGLPFVGTSKLPIEIIDALDQAAETKRIDPTAPTAADAHESIVAAIQRAPSGLTLIHAQCGLGKTHAAIRVAQERAATEHKNPGLHTRAPVQSKTSISVPTTELAEQIASQIANDGTPVMRLFGPLSLKRGDGTPECRYAATAVHLANGGQSIPWELCRGRGQRRCEYYDTCKARDGATGDEHARIAVGPHGLLRRLDGFAGSTGLLVVDEPPSFLASSSFTIEDLLSAQGELDSFEYRYSAALAPVLDALVEWVRVEPTDTAVTIAAVLNRGVKRDLAVKAAFPSDHKGPTHPPVRFVMLDIARKSEPIARKVGLASRLLHLLYRGITDPDQVRVRIEERQDSTETTKRVAIFTESDVDLSAAVTRSGAVVALDANADLHLPVLARITSNPSLAAVRAFAPDPVEVTRVQYSTRASRASWMQLNRLRSVDPLRVPMLHAVNRLLAFGAKRVAIVTMRVIELGLRFATGEDTSQAWADAGQSPGILQDFRSTLAPILSRLPTTPQFGHYGALRGLNKWAGFDGLLTLGDPWPNLGDLRHEAAFLELPEDGDDRAAAFCRAELEQAHGRLRVPHRSTPCIQVHVGRSRPGGWTGDIELHQLADMGRPAGETTMSAGDFASVVSRMGGQRRAAEVLGVTPKSIRRYLTGERPVPQDVMIKISSIEVAQESGEEQEP